MTGLLLTIDAGNTNTVFAIFDQRKLLGKWRMATDARRTADEYGVWLLLVMQRQGIAPEDISGAIIASVVPQSLFALRSLCKHYFNTAALVVGDPRLDLGMKVEVDRPSEVGADRLVNAVAAFKRYGGPLIVLDFGTATTFDVVSGEGAYRGGVISPGINLSVAALHQAAAKLPNIAVARPEKVIGTSTVGAMQSGVFHGYIGLIEGLVSRIAAEYGSPMKTVATGGLATLFSRATPAIDLLDDDLTLHGLYDIYERNAHLSVTE